MLRKDLHENAHYENHMHRSQFLHQNTLNFNAIFHEYPQVISYVIVTNIE